eukprot:10777406-Heterocapsa_arctica.AAC.1
MRCSWMMRPLHVLALTVPPTIAPRAPAANRPAVVEAASCGARCRLCACTKSNCRTSATSCQDLGPTSRHVTPDVALA